MDVHNRCVHYDLPIHCAYCGQEVVNFDHERDDHLSPCQHTLFVGHDEGWEYISDRMKDEMITLGFKIVAEDDGYVQVEGLDDDEHFGHPNDVIGLSKIADALAVVATVGMPSGFSTYVAFAPMEDGS